MDPRLRGGDEACLQAVIPAKVGNHGPAEPAITDNATAITLNETGLALQTVCAIISAEACQMVRDAQPFDEGLSLASWTPRRRGDVVSQPAGVETLLYDPAADAVHVLNATALAVWELCDGRHTAAQTEAELCAHFVGTGGRDVAGDVARVLARFRAESVLE
jgi:hypothetical protein